MGRKRRIDGNSTLETQSLNGSTTSSQASRAAKRTKFTLDRAVVHTVNTQNGQMLVTGSGELGQLGLGVDILQKLRPALNTLDEHVVDLCAGGMHTVCLTASGRIYTFGCNDEGALGRKTADDEEAEFTPATVQLPGKVVQISAGDSHTGALLADGRAFAWGTFRDSHGSMGLTVEGEKMTEPHELLNNVVKIASGTDHLVFLRTDGAVYTCGCGEQGQLGRTSERSSSRFARSGAGNARQIGKLLTPAKINLKPSLKLVFDNVWAGAYATFIKVVGRDDIYVFGLNNYLQLGTETKSGGSQFAPARSIEFSTHKWRHIAPGQHHTVAVDVDGVTYVIGRKEYGRLGLGESTEDATVLTQVTALKEHRITDVSCGMATSFAVTETGKLYGWGMGSCGQLGSGTEEDCLEPTLVQSRPMAGHQVIRVSSGGQHTVILQLVAVTDNNNETVTVNGDDTDNDTTIPLSNNSHSDNTDE